MKITVQVKPNSRKESVEEVEAGKFVVRVNAPPVDGRANERVIKLLAEHFHLPKSAFELVSGHRGKTKVIRISTIA